MGLADSSTTSVCRGMEPVDITADANAGLELAESLSVGSGKTTSYTITKRDLDAFMGKCDAFYDGPFANLNQDIAMVLNAGRSPKDRVGFVNHFKVLPGVSSVASTALLTVGELPLYDVSDDEDSDCESESCWSSDAAPSERAMNSCLSERATSSVEAERIFAIMTELMILYGLETCLTSIREDDGERVFVVHRMPSSKIWRTQRYVSLNVSQLLVERGIPTVIPDMSKDPRFANEVDANSQSGRVFVQAPIGWNDTESWIGVMNLVGKKDFLFPKWQDYDLVMRRADDIASAVAARRT